jgi:hypothetical protein
MKPDTEFKYALLVEERLRGKSWQAMSLHDDHQAAIDKLRKTFPQAKNFLATTDFDEDETRGTFDAWRKMHFIVKRIEILK